MWAWHLDINQAISIASWVFAPDGYTDRYRASVLTIYTIRHALQQFAFLCQRVRPQEFPIGCPNGSCSQEKNINSSQLSNPTLKAGWIVRAGLPGTPLHCTCTCTLWYQIKYLLLGNSDLWGGCYWCILWVYVFAPQIWFANAFVRLCYFSSLGKLEISVRNRVYR